jgi:site-specific recombinase XerD
MSDSKIAHAPSFPELVRQFFVDYLLNQRAISPNTIASYRDAMLLFLDFAHERLGKAPSALRLVDISPDLLLAFLDDLEQRRGNSVHSRNLRLSARAFLKFAEHRDVASLQAIEQALGVPRKRFERPMLGFLTREEMLAVIGEPGTTWTSQRDHLLLNLLYNTGARVSEIIAVRVADVVLDVSACVHLHGKGRKQRAVPLWPATAREARAWLRRNPALRGGNPVTAQSRRTRDDTQQRQSTPEARCRPRRRGSSQPRQTACIPALHSPLDRDAYAAVRRALQRHCTLPRSRNAGHHASIR